MCLILGGKHGRHTCGARWCKLKGLETGRHIFLVLCSFGGYEKVRVHGCHMFVVVPRKDVV